VPVGAALISDLRGQQRRLNQIQLLNRGAVAPVDHRDDHVPAGHPNGIGDLAGLKLGGDFGDLRTHLRQGEKARIAAGGRGRRVGELLRDRRERRLLAELGVNGLDNLLRLGFVSARRQLHEDFAQAQLFANLLDRIMGKYWPYLAGLVLALLAGLFGVFSLARMAFRRLAR